LVEVEVVAVAAVVEVVVDLFQTMAALISTPSLEL
jgi:type III secretory pathway component EscS